MRERRSDSQVQFFIISHGVTERYVVSRAGGGLGSGNSRMSDPAPGVVNTSPGGMVHGRETFRLGGTYSGGGRSAASRWPGQSAPLRSDGAASSDHHTTGHDCREKEQVRIYFRQFWDPITRREKSAYCED
jgi:hypothetical protein